MLSPLELRQRIVFAIETGNAVALRSLKNKLIEQYRRVYAQSDAANPSRVDGCASAAPRLPYVWLKRQPDIVA